MYNNMSMKSQFKSQTILITGGTGFVGSHLVEELLKQGFSNIHVTSYGSTSLLPKNLLDDKNIHKLNLTNKTDTINLFKKIKPDQIYHLAAIAAVGSTFDKTKWVVDTNTSLQFNVLEAMKQITPKAKLLTIGSAMEYQAHDSAIKETDPVGPFNPYGVSKLTQTMLSYSYAKAYKLNIVMARSFNHIGERQNLGFAIPDFIQQIVDKENQKGQTITVGNLAATRDFSDVKDVAKAYILLMEKGIAAEIYNVGSGKDYSIKYILNQLLSMAKQPITVQVDKSKFRPVDIPKVVANNDKVKKLGWKPTKDITATLQRVLNFVRNNN